MQLLEILDRKYFYAKEIIVILDNAKYHYSEEVREVVEKSARLKLVYLPAYSPEHNLLSYFNFFHKLLQGFYILLVNGAVVILYLMFPGFLTLASILRR